MTSTGRLVTFVHHHNQNYLCQAPRLRAVAGPFAAWLDSTGLIMARVLVIEHDQSWQQVISEGLSEHRLEICPALTDAGRLLEK